MWTHNDSHNRPNLFAIDEKGELIRSYAVPGAINHDWEDIGLDSEGNIDILDNTSRKDPKGRNTIDMFPEPDPKKDESIRQQRKIYLQFPEGDGPFDCETLFVWAGKVYLITKPWDGSRPKVYSGNDLIHGGRLKFVAEIPVNAMITGGDISVDGRRIALSSYRALLIFEGEAEPDSLLKSKPLISELNAGQVEGIAWKNEQII